MRIPLVTYLLAWCSTQNVMDAAQTSYRIYEDNVSKAIAKGPVIPLNKASWYDINGDGIIDFVSKQVYISGNEGYAGIAFDNNGQYGNLMNVGGDNGILWYNNHVRHIDTGIWSIPKMDGAADDIRYVYYPADVNNDGRYDLLRLGAEESVPNPKCFFTLSHGGQSFSANYDIISLDEYLNAHITGSSGSIQSALSSMSGMGIWSPPVYEKSLGVKFESHDINNDGLPDIVDFVHGKIFYNIGKNGYAATEFGGQMIVRDLNGDGMEDFIIHDSSNRTITSYIQTPQGGVVEKKFLSGYYCAGDIYSADLNSDGNVDLVIPISDSNQSQCQFILIMENKGDGTFKKHECPLSQVGSVFDMRDFDNDGVYDLLMLITDSDRKIIQYPIKNFKIAEAPIILDTTASRQVDTSISTSPGMPTIILPDISNLGRNMIYYHSGKRAGALGLPIEPVSNTLPVAPSKPGIFYEPSTGLLKVTWNRASDKETPQADLTYSLRVGTAPGMDDIVTADALPDGRRRNLTGGNMGYSLQRTLDTSSWPSGKLYISIQAVDGANGGSPFSEYTIFEKREPANDFLLSYDRPFAIGDTCAVSLTTRPEEGCTYQWNFSGGRVIRADEKTQTYDVVFDSGGEKTVSLTVSSSDYTTSPVSQILDVHPGNIKPGRLYDDKGNDFRVSWAADIDEDGEYEIYDGSRFKESIYSGIYKDIQRLYNNHSSVSKLFPNICTDINGDGHVDIFGTDGIGAINCEDKDMEIVDDLFDFEVYYNDKNPSCYDLNNDGKLDFIVDNAIFANDGNYQKCSEVNKIQNRFSPLKWGDYTGDGLIDYIYCDNSSGLYSFRIYENQGDFTFKAQEPFSVVKLASDEEYIKVYDVRDFDNNGKLDVLFGRVIARDRYALFIRWDDGEETPVAGNLDNNDFMQLISAYAAPQAHADLDNNGFVDIYSEAAESIQKEHGIWGYVAYLQFGRKFVIKKIDHDSDDGYGFNFEESLFIASDGRRYSVRGEGSVAISNERPMPPTALRHSQNSKTVVIEWNPSVDKETPAAGMSYNISIKHKGIYGEGAYLFSPCNGGKNGVPVPTGKQLLNATRFTIPITNIMAGEYEVKVQGIDLMGEASDFSEIYIMNIEEQCGIELPATGEVGYPVDVDILSNLAASPDWDGGEAESVGDGKYKIIWHTAGRKCITVGDESAWIYVKEAPKATFSLPPISHLGDRICISGHNVQEGDWEIRIANSPYDWERLSDTSASRFASLRFSDDGKAWITFKVTHDYEIRHSVSEGYAVVQYIAVTSVGDRRIPEIKIVDIDEVTGKYRIQWNAIPDSDILGINIYKETSIAGNYTLLAKKPVSSNYFIDQESFPDVKASRYLLTYELSCGESADGVPHKPIHVMINRGIGDAWNLIWSKYEGVDIDTYRILRGTSPEALVAIDEVPGNMTSYCDVTPPSGPLCYAVEIIVHSNSGESLKSVKSENIFHGYSRSNVVVTNENTSVNLVRKIEVHSVTGSNTINYQDEKYLDLVACVYPSNATFMNPNWIITSGKDIATIDACGHVTATGLCNGEATVMACAIDGSGISGEFTLNVSGVQSGVGPVGASVVNPLTVYPTVADVEIHVSGLPVDENGRSQLSIYNINGAIVYHATATGQIVTVNCSSFADGVYIIKAMGNYGVAATRFIKR